MASFATQDRSSAPSPATTIEPKNNNSLNVDVGVSSSLRDDFLKSQESMRPGGMRAAPTIVAQNPLAQLGNALQSFFPEAELRNNQLLDVQARAGDDLVRFADTVAAKGFSGSSWEIVKQCGQAAAQNIGQAIPVALGQQAPLENSFGQWLTRPAKDAYAPNAFVNKIDPGGAAEAELRGYILKSSGKVGIDEIYDKALTAADGDGTKAAVVMANLLKKVCATERGAVAPNAKEGQENKAILGKLENYRPDGSSPTDLYYHSATLAVLASTKIPLVTQLAARVENLDFTAGNDKYESAFQSYFAVAVTATFLRKPAGMARDYIMNQNQR